MFVIPTVPLTHSKVQVLRDQLIGFQHKQTEAVLIWFLLTCSPEKKNLLTRTLSKTKYCYMLSNKVILNMPMSDSHWTGQRAKQPNSTAVWFGFRLQTASSCSGASAWLCVCRTTLPLSAANPTTGSCSGSFPAGQPRTCTATEVSPSCPPSLRAAGMRARGQSPESTRSTY